MPRILVVDDSPTILKVVSAILARSGIEHLTARDGVRGLELLAAGEPVDLILLDFVMPKMNGYQFCRELRKEPAFKSLPVVLMSAKSDRIRDQFVQQTGAADAITKPFDARTLVAVVEGVLAKVKAGRGPQPPEAETMPEEESLGETSDEPRPSLLPRQLEQRAASEVIKHVTAVVAPAILALPQSELGKRDSLDRAIAKALSASPLDVLLTALREATSATTKEVLSGDMAFVPLPEVLQVLQMQRQTGVMRLLSGARSVSVFMREGTVDLARATYERSEYKLGRYFVEMGKLTRKEVDAALDRAQAKSLRLGDALVADKKVSDEERREALAKQSCEIMYDLVRWQTGRFWFAREPHSAEAADAKLGLAVAGLVLEGFRRVDEWRLMEGTIVWEDVVVVDEAALSQVESSFNRSERLLLAAVDGKRTVTQIVDECEITRFDALKILYQLLSSRVLRSIRPTHSEILLAPPPRIDDSTTEGSVTEAP